MPTIPTFQKVIPELLQLCINEMSQIHERLNALLQKLAPYQKYELSEAVKRLANEVLSQQALFGQLLENGKIPETHTTPYIPSTQSLKVLHEIPAIFASLYESLQQALTALPKVKDSIVSLQGHEYATQVIEVELLLNVSKDWAGSLTVQKGTISSENKPHG